MLILTLFINALVIVVFTYKYDTCQS